MNQWIRHLPDGAEHEEVAAEALRDALQQCFEPVADQAIPADMLRLLARAATRQPAPESA